MQYIRSGKYEKVEQLSSHLYLIDDFDLQHNERTGTYVLLGDDITLIETCAAPSLPYILDGLQQLHIDLNDVKNIIVTHVHLDHAGANWFNDGEVPKCYVICAFSWCSSYD